MCDKFEVSCEEIMCNIMNHIAQYRALPNNAAKLRFAFTMCDDFKYFKPSESKDYELAEATKAVGNQLFQRQCNAAALHFYNEAITVCPQDDVEGKKLYAILIANRSAVFFGDGAYQNVLQDVAFLQQYGHHPNPEKITARGNKALDALLRERKVIELEDDGTVKTPLRKEFTWCSGNQIYPALSKKLTINRNNSMRPYVVATDDFNTGEIVAIEKPYAAVITDKANCDYCGISTDHIYACPKCKTVYCSNQCLQKAWMYHQYECLIDDPSIPANFRVAFRMITQRPLQQINAEDYNKISQLIYIHGNQSDIDDVTLPAVTVLFLIMLRTTDYFDSKGTSRDLSEEEVFVGELLLKYLRMIILNSKGILELGKEQMGKSLEPNCIGSGFYPTLSLFSHSCDPTVTWYYFKNTLVFRSRKPIKAGDGVFLSYCYGCLYDVVPKEIRTLTLAKYRYTCTCQACVEDWPTLSHMSEIDLPALCDCGGVIHIPLGNVIAGTCAKCNSFKDFPKLKNLYSKLVETEKLFFAGHYDEMAEFFAECIDNYFKYLKPPFGDLVIVQTCLAICFWRMRNEI